jgi:hypothetical protein
MRVTEQTKHLLALRRWRRNIIARGYEEIGEHGGNLWQLYRGARWDHVITHVAIDPSRKSIWVKIEKKTPQRYVVLAAVHAPL